MEEGMTAIAEEQATPAIETQAPQTEPTDDIVDLDAPEEAEAETGSENEGEKPEGETEEETGEEKPDYEPDLVEIELNGKKYAVPAELKDGYLMQADYTRKTQEVAEMRKTAEARVAEAETQFSVSQEVLQARAALMVHDNQLEQYQNMDWQQFENDDPVGAMSAWRQFQQLKETRGNIAGYLNEQQTQRSAQAEQDTANRLRETTEFAKTKIPGWTPEIDAKITDFATSELGFTRETLLGAYSPAVYKTMHLAWLGHQSLMKQQAAPKPQTPNVQPLRTVSAKASPTVTKAPEDMSMEEYVAFRNSQQRKR